jgi:hypothetical protein
MGAAVRGAAVGGPFRIRFRIRFGLCFIQGGVCFGMVSPEIEWRLYVFLSVSLELPRRDALEGQPSNG